MPELAARVQAMQAAFPAYAELLRLAHDYIPTDAAGSLTKSRTLVERVVLDLYADLMGKEPRKGELGALLADNQFTRQFDRRIRERMDGVRAMGNVGTHGEPVRPGDAERALDDVCEVLLWYREHHARGESADPCPAPGGALPLPEAPFEEGPGEGGVGVLTGTTRIELHIEGDLDSFTPQKQERVLRAIRELLSATGDIRVVSKRRGSVRLTLELTPEQAEELLAAVRAGRLREVGVVHAEPADPGRQGKGRERPAVMDAEYRLVRRIGAGAFGEVWAAETPGGIPVALKVMHQPLDTKESCPELEALALVSRLRQPFLLQTMAFWSSGDRLHVVMELADGSLRDRLEECRRAGQPGVPPDELVRHVSEAGAALDFLHSRGVHHRNIKPANILLLGGHVKLADFGLARSLPARQSMHEVTACGTPAYMAPEVWHGQIHTHTDQWSLAATYAELRLNRPLVGGTDLPTVMTRTLTGDFDLTPLPEAEQRVLRKALAIDPHDRYPSCRDFAKALEEALQQPAPPSGSRRETRAPTRPPTQPPGHPGAEGKTLSGAPADRARPVPDAPGQPVRPAARSTDPGLDTATGGAAEVMRGGNPPRRAAAAFAWRGPQPATRDRPPTSARPFRGWLLVVVLAVLAALVALLVYKVAF